MGMASTLAPKGGTLGLTIISKKVFENLGPQIPPPLITALLINLYHNIKKTDLNWLSINWETLRHDIGIASLVIMEKWKISSETIMHCNAYMSLKTH